MCLVMLWQTYYVIEYLQNLKITGNVIQKNRQKYIQKCSVARYIHKKALI